MKQKTRILIYILVGAAVVVMGVLGLLAARSGGSDSAGRSIDLGQKYLVELSYDKAVIAFTEAIDIDPTNIDAYKGIAQAYEGMGDTEKAIEWLRKGYDLTGDSSLKAELDRLMLADDGAPDVPAEDAPITAPSLENLTKAQAEGVCRENGILFEFRYEESNEVTKDYVISQSIKANDEIPKGETLVITVCSGAVQVEMPDLAGLTEEDAKKACEDAGLKYAVTYAGSDTVEKGVVSAQTIPAGAKVSQGIAAPFTVSDGYTVKAELVAENLEFDYFAGFEESGWAFAVRGNKGGYVNTEGKFVEVYDVSIDDNQKCYFSDGYIVNGKLVCEDGGLCGSGMHETHINAFKVSTEGIYPCYQNNKWGYSNIDTGENIIPCIYDDITAFNCGRCMVKSGDEYMILTADNKKINCNIDYNNKMFDHTDLINLRLGSINSFYNNGFVGVEIMGDYVEDDGTLSIAYPIINEILLDENGNVIEYGEWTSEKNNCVISRDKIYGLDGNVVCNIPTGVDVGYLSNRFCVGNGYGFLYNYNNNTNQIIDSKGNIVGEFDVCNSYYNFGKNNRIFMTYNGLDYYLFDFTGKKVCNTAFEKGWDTVTDLIPAKLNGKYGVIDLDGNTVIDFTYDKIIYDAWDNNDSLKFFIAEKDGKNLIVNREDNIIIEMLGTPLDAVFIGENDFITTENNGKYNIYSVTF